jgi:hypothetical protein
LNHLSIHFVPPSTPSSVVQGNFLVMSLGQDVVLCSTSLSSLNSGALAIPSTSSFLKSIPYLPSSLAPHSQHIMWISKLKHEGLVSKRVAASKKSAFLPTAPQP